MKDQEQPYEPGIIPELLPGELCPSDERQLGCGFLFGLRCDGEEGDPEILSDLDPEVVRSVPEHLIQRYKVLPLSTHENTMRLWMADPSNITAIDDIQLITGFKIEPVKADPVVMEKVLSGSKVTTIPGLTKRLDFSSPFPLQEVRMAARISGPLSIVTVSQRFGNPGREPVEAMYIFPLPDGAAVHDFRMKVADRIVEGKIQEKKKARETYEEGKRQGHRAALLEMTRENVLNATVGNLPPGEQVIIELSYAQHLEQNENETVFRFPLVVAPRYIPGAPLEENSGPGRANDTDVVPDASLISPPVLLPGLGSTTKLDISVELECGSHFPDYLACSQHTIALRGAENGLLRVELAKQNELLNRDFVLRFRIESQQPEALLLTHGEHFMLTVMPPKQAPSTRIPRDVVFLLDRSGSMDGEKMKSARNAVSRFIKTLSPEDRFSIFAFDNEVEAFREGRLIPAYFSSDAISWLQSIDARGGTEIVPSLERLLGYLPEEGRLLCAIVITDGEVGNESEIYDLLCNCGNLPRIFTLGIDTAVNDAFLRQLARLGRGTCELVTPGEDLEAALERLGRETGSAVITNLRLIDRGLNFIQESLSPLKDLFASRPVVVTGRKLGTGKVEVAGRLANQEDEWRVIIEPVASNNPALGILWAKDRVAVLEDRRRLGKSRGDSLRDEIVKLALEFHLLTPHTSFVLVDRVEVVNPGGKSQSALQPAEAPEGWSLSKVFGTTDLAEVCETVKDISVQDFGPCDWDDSDEEEIALDKLRELVDEAPIVRVDNLIISQAIKDGASHIHIEPEEHRVRVRYRVDGILQDVMQPPKHIQAPMISRLKLMVGMDLAERRVPQTGKIIIQHDNRDFELTISTIPCVPGEKVVVKIREMNLEIPDLEGLGLYPEIRAALEDILEKKSGVILVAGPSGSGITTTLNALVNKLKRDDINITTIEELIEYKIAGVNQVQINEGASASALLQAMQGQDPDVIMLSEISDVQTAHMCLKYGHAGRLVLSGIYGDDSAGVIPHLGMMGREPHLLASSVKCILAQRLVRKICPHCRESYSIPARPPVAQGQPEEPEMKAYRGRGCDSCKMTGFRGRTAIFELLPVSDRIRSLISGRAGAEELRQAAIAEGMKTMFDDGMRKVSEGITTIEEVLRVTGARLNAADQQAIPQPV